jgi:hypothetical protein
MVKFKFQDSKFKIKGQSTKYKNQRLKSKTKNQEMKTMKLNLNARYCFLCVMKALLFFALIAGIMSFQEAKAQKTYDSKDEAKSSAGQGVIFKTPDKFLPAPMSGFKGTMFLHPDKPAGIFITYPDKDETIDSLSKRARAFFAKMFVHKEEVTNALNWQLQTLVPHLGDKTSATHYVVSENMEMQVNVYEREVNGLTFIYGYFAMRGDKSKADFLNSEGKGVKAFDRFWKSIEAGKGK